MLSYRRDTHTAFHLQYIDTDTKLELRGRARREAARRRKSEWKVNLGSRNSSRSNGSWQMTPKTVSENHVAYGLASPYSVRALRLCQYARYNFFVCGPKFTTSPVKVW